MGNLERIWEEAYRSSPATVVAGRDNSWILAGGVAKIYGGVLRLSDTLQLKEYYVKNEWFANLYIPVMAESGGCIQIKYRGTPEDYGIAFLDLRGMAL